MALSAVGSDDLATFSAMLGPRGMIDAADGAAAPYLVEPRDRWHGRAAAILRPATTAEVAAVVAHCAARRIGLVPYGGGTGLVSGQVAPLEPPPIVLSLERMDRVRAVLPEDGAVTAEAGVILADLQAAAARAGRLFPLSLASEGSCRLGGLLATNAGGVAVLRYGSARDLCLGIEAVLPDGSVTGRLAPLRKDNTGYDLRSLLIGSEGTLGVITAATMKTFPAPGEIVTAMLAVPSPAVTVSLLDALLHRLGDALLAFELIARLGPDWLAEAYPNRADPLPGRPAWRVLLEAAAPSGAGLADRAERALGDAVESGLAGDGVVARSETQAQGLWWWRETIPEVNRRVGAVASQDIAVPVGRIPDFIEAAGRAVSAVDPLLRINCFGHVGDGNLHFNVFPPPGRRAAEYEGIRERVVRAVHDCATALDGTVSAEHGIGRAKTGELKRYADPAKLVAMRAIKRALDPVGIMNPGAVLEIEPPGG